MLKYNKIKVPHRIYKFTHLGNDRYQQFGYHTLMWINR